MGRFLKKIALFLLILLLHWTISFALNFFWLHNQAPPLQKASVLVLGDSHVRKGINPAAFQSAASIAQLGEPYFVSYWKLLTYLKYQKPDTLLLGFNRHNISAFNENKLSDRSWSTEIFDRVYAIERLSFMPDTILIDKWSFYYSKFKNLCLYPYPDNFPWIGGFHVDDVSKPYNAKITLQRHYYRQDSINAGLSLTAMAYLDSIINVCAQEKIKLFLIAPPLHKSYFKGIPANFQQGYQQLKQRLQQRGIPIFDRADADYPDAFFMDADHLNRKGSKQFTPEVVAWLRDSLQN